LRHGQRDVLYSDQIAEATSQSVGFNRRRIHLGKDNKVGWRGTKREDESQALR
jgi:hypothetical protein